MKTHRNNNGEVITPNGYGAKFGKDWYSAVEGNLVMTNGKDYKAWNQTTGKYEAGRAPKAYVGSSRLPYDVLPTDPQIGDTYKQYIYNKYGVNYANGLFGDSRLLQYIGENQWILLEDFSSIKSAEVATWIFPMGGTLKGGGALLKWLSKFNAGRKVLTLAKKATSSFDDIASKVTNWERTKAGRKGSLSGVNANDIIKDLKESGYNVVEQNSNFMKLQKGGETIFFRKSKTGNYEKFDTMTSGSKSILFK